MKPGLTEKQIKEVRLLRRKAVRRRQILVLSLICVILVVFFLALGLHFSPLYTLIPIFLLLMVVILGIRASRQAMAWEKKIAKSKQQQKLEPENLGKFGTDDAPTYILPAQQNSDEVQFRLGPVDTGVKSLDLRAFDKSGFAPQEGKDDLKKADLV
ncbi:MAG: hypothetical protein J6P35_01805 [Aeriscardovia sp.]|nr:hypothetical protein [Aeriscardovia sp.]MBO7717809.1 hypothetical protein [Aeriscardovia sp.]